MHYSAFRTLEEQINRKSRRSDKRLAQFHMKQEVNGAKAGEISPVQLCPAGPTTGIPLRDITFSRSQFSYDSHTVLCRPVGHSPVEQQREVWSLINSKWIELFNS